jgi:hypothetical protein
MLTHPTLERLQTLKLTGMARALAEQLARPEADGPSPSSSAWACSSTGKRPIGRPVA